MTHLVFLGVNTHHGAWVKVRGQLSRDDCLLPSCEWVLGSNSGPEIWQEECLPSEPSCWPTSLLFSRLSNPKSSKPFVENTVLPLVNGPVTVKISQIDLVGMAIVQCALHSYPRAVKQPCLCIRWRKGSNSMFTQVFTVWGNGLGVTKTVHTEARLSLAL